MMQRGCFNYSKFEYVTNREYDPWQIFIQLMPGMFSLARDAARDEANSYRNFHVGAAIYAIDEETRETSIFSAGNRKISPKTKKYCAEMSVIDQAEATGLTRAIGLVVAGTTDGAEIEGVTGRVTPTLHPCESCRNVFDESPLIRPETLVVSIGKSSDVRQVHSVAELQKFYSDKDHPDAHHHEDPDLTDWETRQAMYGIMTNDLLFPVQAARPEIARMVLTAYMLAPEAA